MTNPINWPFPSGNKPPYASGGYVDNPVYVQGPQAFLTKEQLANIRLETDPNGKDLNSPGAKADAGKNRVWLFMQGFSNALEEVSKVTTVGATKYTPNGWVDVPDGQARYMDAFGRHLLALGKGEVLDNGKGGTGCYHKAQLIWNLLASFELELREMQK